MSKSLLVPTTVEIPEGKHIVHLLSSAGDDTLVYDPTIDAEVKEAMKTFDESMAKGMTAYTTDEKGGNGTVTKSFDKTAPRTVLVPQIVGG